MRYILILVLLLLAACGAGDKPVPIERNEDLCDNCAMVITDVKYASEIIKGGQAKKFDDLMCLVLYARKNNLSTPGAKFWVIDFVGGGWVKGEAAHYVHSPEIRSPMASGLAAFASSDEASKLAAATNGTVISFSKMMQMHFEHLKH